MVFDRTAFVLLALGEAIFLTLILAGGAAYPGYDQARQYISELGATGAPTGWAVSWLGFLPSGLLIVAFCLMAAWSLRRRALFVLGLILMAVYAYGLINSAFYPCAFECGRETATPAQAVHDLIGGAGYLAGVLALFTMAAASLRGAPRWMCALGVVCGAAALAGLVGVAADIALRGAAQRVLEAALGGFLLAFGWALARGRIAPARS